MPRYPQSRRFSMAALHVFECAARHQSFSRAATELNTSQSSVSRHIADLEWKLSVKLFEREHRRVRSTEAGDTLYAAVTAALRRIEIAAETVVSNQSDTKEVVIACGLVTSQLFLLPRSEGLRRAIGEDVNVRTLTCDYDMLDRLGAPYADIVIGFDPADSTHAERRVACDQEAIAVCSPDFAAANRDVLRQPVKEWGVMPFLSYARPSRGWATWDDWFGAFGRPEPPPEYTDYEDYMYLIDACAAGRGLAVSWRALADRLIDSGALVTAVDRVLPLPHPLYAWLTNRGRSNSAARQCLEFFGALPGSITDLGRGTSPEVMHKAARRIVRV